MEIMVTASTFSETRHRRTATPEATTLATSTDEKKVTQLQFYYHKLHVRADDEDKVFNLVLVQEIVPAVFSGRLDTDGN